MLLSVAFALYAENYSRFFERTDLAQSVFLVNMFAIGFPFKNLQTFLHIFFLPYLASNIILLAVGFLKELEYDQCSVYVENFYRFFWKKRFVAISLCLAMAFLLGTPPLPGFYWRIEFLGAICKPGWIWSFVAYIICFYSLGYVYLKWILATFQNKSSTQEASNRILPNKINWLIILCSFVILGCLCLAHHSRSKFYL
jgi:NADH:ubiquinone oxidoreductase subunit 2 (subunit N)